VLALCHGLDPITKITASARQLVFRASEAGWTGPPYDPFQLAEIQNIKVIARQDIPEARTISSSDGRYIIEFNPNRPRHRINYSICHELAHTFFPDCAARVRHRLSHNDMTSDDWQLEMLCNIAAAELVMPIGSFPSIGQEELSIDAVLGLRKQYEVSVDAVLLRAIHLTSTESVAFSASVHKHGTEPRYVVDFAVPSRSWSGSRLYSGSPVPKNSVATKCIAIGYTAKAIEPWPRGLGNVRVECVGLPPYPGQTLPRVAGIIMPEQPLRDSTPRITYLRGDATSPHGETGSKLIVQIVSDKALTWGAGFALAARRKWPRAQDSFKKWALTRSSLKLGNVHSTDVDDDVLLLSMVAQHGYGPSPSPRIRYAALERCLIQVRDLAHGRKASVHMPRIGAGQARGIWAIISEMIDEVLCRAGIAVFVYDLPNSTATAEQQQSIFDQLMDVEDSQCRNRL
jgi:Zn-dependent peptidase ImmA (M78 family)